MSRRVRPSPLLRAIERATTAMTRRALRAGADAAGKAAARGVE
ncbi:esterase, PHB depolymerase family protein, partial [Thauera aminoaromatica S2]